MYRTLFSTQRTQTTQLLFKLFATRVLPSIRWTCSTAASTLFAPRVATGQHFRSPANVRCSYRTPLFRKLQTSIGTRRISRLSFVYNFADWLPLQPEFAYQKLCVFVIASIHVFPLLRLRSSCWPPYTDVHSCFFLMFQPLCNVHFSMCQTLFSTRRTQISQQQFK